MSSQKIAVIALAASSLFAGCVGTGPNTQQGAVTGGALGALAGAIIGNNSGSRNALGGAVIGGALGAIAGGTIGNSVDNEKGTVYDPYATRTVVVNQPPRAPAPVVETVSGPRPADNAVWIPGYWDYRGAPGYVWTGGHWEIPPPLTHQYVSAHWEDRAGTFVFVRGYWR